MRRPCSAPPRGSSSPPGSRASGRATRRRPRTVRPHSPRHSPAASFSRSASAMHRSWPAAATPTRKPLAAMREHLDGMAATRYVAPAPASRPHRCCWPRSRPGMMQPRRRANRRRPPVPRHAGAHRGRPGDARAGEDPRSRAGVVARGSGAARAVAREHLAVYLPLENYTRCWRRLGFGDADLADGGSDRLVDALVAWGDEEADRGARARRISTRVRATCPCRCSAPIRSRSSSGWHPILTALS